MKQKQLYEAPRVQAFVVQPEGMICTSDPLEVLATLDPLQGFEETAIIEDASSTLWW